MFAFVVFFLGPLLVKGIQLGDPSGLHFDSTQEYATSYEDYKPSDYKFEYGVSDPHTGDHKSHWEVKENGVVRGEYSLLEPDGTTRIVQYTADDAHGFRAIVKKIGTSVHPISENYQKNAILAEVPQQIDNTRVYKTYDGSRENYVTSLHPESNHENDLIYVKNPLPFLSNNPVPSNNVPLYSEQNQQLSYIHGDHIRNIYASEQPLQSVFDNTRIIGNTEYLSNYAQSNSAATENSHYYFPKLQHVHQVPTILNNIQYSPIPFQYQNAFDHIQENNPEIQHPSIGPLSLGIRIDHPHGDSSSSFFGKTGNAEDDTVYRKYDSNGVIH